jgi:hypothetical protein
MSILQSTGGRCCRPGHVHPGWRAFPLPGDCYLDTLKSLSPDLVEMSDCSTPDTLAADGPLFNCWTKLFKASALP